MSGFEGQALNTSHSMALMSVSNSINHLYGNTATAITKPTGSSYTVLVLHVESGSFRLQLGDTTGSISASDPSASVTNGTGSMKLLQDAPMAITAPATFTVIGSSGTDILTYYWA